VSLASASCLIDCSPLDRLTATTHIKNQSIAFTRRVDRFIDLTPLLEDIAPLPPMIPEQQDPERWRQLRASLEHAQVYSSGQAIYTNPAALQSVLNTFQLLLDLQLSRALANEIGLVKHSLWDFFQKIYCSPFLQVRRLPIALIGQSHAFVSPFSWLQHTHTHPTQFLTVGAAARHYPQPVAGDTHVPQEVGGR
jgi:hypothetical protein